MFVKAFLLNMYFYNIKMNLSKYGMAGDLLKFEYFSFKIKINSIFVSMATMEATLVLGLFQLLILKGY